MAENPGQTTGDEGDGGSVSDGFVLPEALQSSEHLKEFKSYDEIAQAHHDLKSNQPVVPEQYTYDAPEGHELDGVMSGMFNDLSKKIGLTDEQYKAVMEFDFKRQEYEIDQIVKDRENTKLELQKEHGDKYDEVVGRAKLAVYALMGEEAGKEMFLDPSYGDDPQFIKLAIAVSSKISEESLQIGDGEGNGDNRPVGEDGNPRLKYPSMGDK